MRNRAVRGCLIAILFAIVATTTVHSKETSGHSFKNLSEQQTGSSENQKPSTTDKRGTLELPFVVKSIEPEKTQQEAEDDARERDDKRWNDRATLVVSLVTLLILIVQAIAFFVQAARLQQTIEAMKKIGAEQSKDMQGWIGVADKSAEAAKKSAEAAVKSSEIAIKSQEAHLALEGIEQTWGWTRQDHKEAFGIQAVLRNTGNTPARNAKLLVGFHVTEPITRTDNLFEAFKMNIDFGINIGTGVQIRTEPLFMSADSAKELWDKKKRCFIRVWTQFETVFEPGKIAENIYDLEVRAFENPYDFKFEQGNIARIFRFDAIPKS
ncbi:MAG: hypothetical protein WBD78_05180 [Methylocella sp.]